MSTSPALSATLTIAAVALISGCSTWGPEGGPGGDSSATTATSTPPSQPAATGPATSATQGPDGIQRITIQAGDDLRYRPALITAHAGTIEITVHNTGVTPHTLTFQPPLPGPASGSGIDNLNGGQTQTIRIAITQPGHYAFQCAYHATNGMQGTLDIH